MKQYFGIKAHFYSQRNGKRHSVSVEERVICLRAKDLQDALRLGEVEAKQYAADHHRVTPGDSTCRLIYPIEVFWMFDPPGNEPFEVYSSIHKRFPANSFLRKFFPSTKRALKSKADLRPIRAKRVVKRG